MIKARASHPNWNDGEYIYSETWGEESFQKREFYFLCFPVGFSHYPKDVDWKIEFYTGFDDEKGNELYYGDLVFDRFLKMNIEIEEINVSYWIVERAKGSDPSKYLKLLKKT